MGRSIEQLVDQEVLRWLKAQEAKEPPSSRVREVQRPMITISREYGSYGGELGRKIAAALDIDFFAQELIHQVAARSEVRAQVVAALDERVQNRLQLWVDDLIRLRRFTQSDYVDGLTQTLVALGRHSSGVIVGRAGHLVLDKERTLRVRCYAPIETRIEHVARREGMSEEEARLKVQRVDDERRRFYLDHFDNDITSPLNFDVMINTAALSPDESIELVTNLFRHRFG